MGDVGNLALKKKGLRPLSPVDTDAFGGWKPCPEEKGIKTRPRGIGECPDPLETLP